MGDKQNHNKPQHCSRQQNKYTMVHRYIKLFLTTVVLCQGCCCSYELKTQGFVFMLLKGSNSLGYKMEQSVFLNLILIILSMNLSGLWPPQAPLGMTDCPTPHMYFEKLENQPVFINNLLVVAVAASSLLLELGALNISVNL